MGGNYFSGLNFSLGGNNPSYCFWHRHVPTYYGIQYNHSGALRVIVDRKIDVSMEGPCAFISHPGAFFEYGSPDGKPRSHNFVCFFGPRVQSFIEGGLLEVNSAHPLVRISKPQRFLMLISELASAIHGSSSERPSPERMTLMLEDLLLQMREGTVAAYDDGDSLKRKLLELVAEVESASEQTWDFNEEAVKLGVTLTHLRRLFRKFAGLPPQQYLIQLRLRKAAEMLVGGQDTISEIAGRTGIGSEFYFSRLFKMRYAMSPTKYRQEFARSELERG